MDLMGPMQVESVAGKRYIFVCVDDFSKYTWVDFLREMSDTFDAFKKLIVKLKTDKGWNISKIIRIRSDHGKEFKNSSYTDFRDSNGITHKFSAPKTPQQNGVVEKKSRTLQD